RRHADRLGGRVAVKAQVQIGGRGKAGGIALVDSADEAEAAAEKILTGGFGGTPVTRVLVEQLGDNAEQFYVAITLDRTTKRYVAMVSSEGGVDIEEVAKTNPAAIRRASVDPILGLKEYQVRYLTGHLSSQAAEGCADVLRKMYELLTACDATLVEINPLVLLPDGRVVALDS